MSYKKNACLKTIALELGVSINTVSRALRDCSDISSKTKDKVRQKALEMGYLPNNLLYSLKENNSHLIALVINNIKNYYFAIMAERLMYYLEQEGYHGVIISLYGNEFNEKTVKECIYQRVDGIISFVEPTKKSIEISKLNNIPFLLLGRRIEDKNVDCIYTNDVTGGRLAAKYLYEKGVRNFVYINVKGSECSDRRYHGFMREIRDIYKTTKVRKINIEDFESQIEEILSLDNVGYFAYNDEHAYIILSILYKYVGKEIFKTKIVGYDAICQNIKGVISIPSIGFNYDAIAKMAIFAMANPMSSRERFNLSFDVKLYE